MAALPADGLGHSQVNLNKAETPKVRRKLTAKPRVKAKLRVRIRVKHKLKVKAAALGKPRPQRTAVTGLIRVTRATKVTKVTKVIRAQRAIKVTTPKQAVLRRGLRKPAPRNR